MRQSLPVLAFVTGLVLAACAAHAFTPAHVWSQRFGGTSSDFANSVAVDPSGNIIVAGQFAGTANFGGVDLVSSGGSTDIFVAKYDANGAHIWSQRFGGTGTDAANGLAVDLSGTVVVVGSFQVSADFGGGSLTSAGSNDIFIAKYSAGGTHQWSVAYGGSGNDYATAVYMDNNSNVYTTGAFTGVVNFGGGLYLSQGGTDIFLQKHFSNGSHAWTQMAGGPSNDAGNAIAVDASGSPVVTGYFQGTTTFGVALTSNGSEDVLLARYNTTGTLQWASGYGSVNGDRGNGVAVDATGNIVVIGYFLGSAGFGGVTLVNQGLDVFLAKYNSAGTHDWSQRFGGTSSDFGYAVAIDVTGHILTAGHFAGTADFGSGPLTSAGGNDIVIGRYDATGTPVWAQRLGGSNTDQCRAIAPDAGGNAIVAGYFAGTTDFGGGPLTSAGSFDAVLARYSADPREPRITAIEDIGNDQGRQVIIRFVRSAHDQAGSTQSLLRYEAYRRDDPAPAATGQPASAARADGWTEVGTVDAHGETTYGIVVPTLGDSTETLGQYYSAFYIRAATDNPLAFHDSPADSGYSLDNLAPGIPGSLLYNGGVLSWNESPAEDFDFFTVYGASTNDFGAATLVDYTIATDMDVTASPYVYYFVTATDFSGNEGKSIGVNSAAGVGDASRSYVLSVSNFPNPFNPRTTVSYTIPAQGNVSIAIYDARGARVATLVDNESRDAGVYRVEWDGRADAGAAVSSGVYFARIEQAGAVRTKKMVLLK